MKYLKLALVLLVATTLSPAPAFCAGKILTCTIFTKGKPFLVWSAVFNTDDFTKERPHYEYTCVDVISDEPYAKAFFKEGVTRSSTYSVSPTTISFLEPPLGIGAISEPYHVSRESLKFTNADGKEIGQCEIADHKPKNRL